MLLKEDVEKCGALLNACVGLCVLLAALVEPYMPSITAKVNELYTGYMYLYHSQANE